MILAHFAGGLKKAGGCPIKDFLIGHLCFFTLFPSLYPTYRKAVAECRKDVCSFPDSAGPSGRSRSPRQRSISKQGEYQNNYGYIHILYYFGGGFNLAIRRL